MNEKINWLLANGFSNDGITYCVGGGNTYDIKELLKEKDFIYNPTMGWHSARQTDLPQPYFLIQFSFDELYEWSDYFNKPLPFENTYQKIIEMTKPVSISNFIGTIGDRITLEVIFVKSFKNRAKKLYIFKSDNDIINWETTKDLTWMGGSKLTLTGTIVEHSFYNDMQITKMNRCSF